MEERGAEPEIRQGKRRGVEGEEENGGGGEGRR